MTSNGPFHTERILYDWGAKDQPGSLSMRDSQKASAFALHMRKTEPVVNLVTVGSREFYVCRYEGELNDSPNAELSTQEILDTYIKRWLIELFFRQSKSKLALDSYQIRSRQGIQRYWLIMSLVHYLCWMHSGNYCTFEEAFKFVQNSIFAHL